MTRHILTLVPLFILAISRAPSVLASPCVAFNINWELLAFGFDGKDYNAGTQDQWASGTSTIAHSAISAQVKTMQAAQPTLLQPDDRK